ncbi:MAG: hypothetical protein GPOALKHO_000974 [Sodalis sp.]|uniref:hypothetical protein n=1 Tax=Sodalis sp. (in: enterobacteria) TaxID=1898979 RepID=UPI0038737F57|nr:MAG: hypothetical protein GPOALKHO_000974 [Sodalis sp.]
MKQLIEILRENWLSAASAAKDGAIELLNEPERSGKTYSVDVKFKQESNRAGQENP